MRRYVVIDGHKYAVVGNSYSRSWQRLFTPRMAASIVRLNFVDRGPGCRIYKMQLLLTTWPAGSTMYQDGVTETLDQQRQNLEATYAKISSSIEFVDPFGETPIIPPGPDEGDAGGVYMTSLTEIIPQYSSVDKPYVLMEIECTEATQIVA